MIIIVILLGSDYMIKIATSILSANNRIDCIKKLNNTDTDYIHIDVMDNVFVPNYQLPLEEVNELIEYTDKPFDIHLMVTDPEPFIKGLHNGNIECITIHIEINKDIDKLIGLIKELGYQVGLAIKPQTDINLIKKYLNSIDKIIVMSVEPGFGGQRFIETTPERILALKNLRQDIIIEVDGGINDITIPLIKDNTDIAVVGSYITNKENYQEAINNLKN